MSGRNLAPLIHHYLQMFERQALEYLEAEIEQFSSALHYWLYDFYLNPNVHWETSLDDFLAWQVSEGRAVPAEYRQQLIAQLRSWVRSKAEDQRRKKDSEEFRAWESAALKDPEHQPPLKIHLIPDPPPVPRPDPPPRIVSSRVIVGFGGRYDQMVASGEYDPNILIRAAVGVLRTLFPSSEPTVHYVFEDGTEYFAIGGGPNSGDLAGQATVILIPARAVAGATGHRVFVRQLAGQFARSTVKDVGEAVFQEATGLPVVPGIRRIGSPQATSLGPPRRKSTPLRQIYIGKPHNTGTPGHSHRTLRVAIELAESGRYQKIYMNRSYKTATGIKTSPDRRPDVLGERKTGEFDAIEIPSKTDKAEDLIRRNEEAMLQLPPPVQGDIRIRSIRKSP